MTTRQVLLLFSLVFSTLGWVWLFTIDPQFGAALILIMWGNNLAQQRRIV